MTDVEQEKREKEEGEEERTEDRFCYG